MYAITATVGRSRPSGWASTSTRQVPTFYLDESVQGIVNAEHAERIAREIIDPFGEYEVHVNAVQVDAVPAAEPRDQTAEVTLLLTAWISAEVSAIGETSRDFAKDYRLLVDAAKQQAVTVGVPWHDHFVPDHVWYYLSDTGQP